MTGAERHRIQAGVSDDPKPAGSHQLPLSRGIRQPPLRQPCCAVDPGQRAAAGQQRESELDLVGAQQLAGAHGPDRGQRPQRIAQMQQQAAADHDVEAPDPLRTQLVDAERLAPDRRAEQLVRGAESDAGELTGHVAHVGRTVTAQMVLPVPVLVALDVDRHHLRRPPPLELERKESVGGTDIQAAATGHVGPWQAVDRIPQIEPARGEESGSELDRVVPERDLGDARGDLVPGGGGGGDAHPAPESMSRLCSAAAT
jgi:hypothetical protein